jgi:hypothetical protein
MLLARAHWHDETRVAREQLDHLGRAELLQAARLERRARIRRGERLSHSG